MARIAGVDLPREKRAEIGLTYIYGIGRATSNEILAKAGISKDARIKDLSDDEVNVLRKIIDEDYLVEGDLRREISLNIKRLRDIKCYRGISIIFLYPNFSISAGATSLLYLSCNLEAITCPPFV